MSIDTDGKICYGVRLGEDTEYPWDNDIYDGELEEWWLLHVCGFKNDFEIWDADGEYIEVEGVRPSDAYVESYYQCRQDFEGTHPTPVELINYCSDSYPEYILAIPGTILSASRGWPESFEPAGLTITDAQKETFLSFCKTYNIDTSGGLRWWLCVYYGV